MKTGLFNLGNKKFITNPTCNVTQHYYDIRVLSLLLLLIFIVLPKPYTFFSLVFLCVIITNVNFYLKIFHSLSSFILSLKPLTSCYVSYYSDLEHCFIVYPLLFATSFSLSLSAQTLCILSVMNMNTANLCLWGSTELLLRELIKYNW